MLVRFIGITDGAVLGVEADGDEEQYREGQQRRATIGEHRQGDANHGHQADGHTHVDNNVEQENASNTIAIDPTEGFILSLAHLH